MGAEGFNLFNDIHALYDVAEDDVSAVQPGGLDGGDEELGAVGVGASVGHGEDAGAGVLQDEVLVGELLAVDGLATSAVVVREVAALQHEVGDDTVEGGALVTEAFLSGAQGTEVFTGFRGHICSQLKQ